MNREELIEAAVQAAWAKRRVGISGQVVVGPPADMYAMIAAALAVFEKAQGEPKWEYARILLDQRAAVAGRESRGQRRLRLARERNLLLLELDATDRPDGSRDA